MTNALDMAIAALQVGARVSPKLELQKYPARLADFIQVTLGCELWDKQIEIANAVDDHRYTSVASCHGAGKSYIAARIVLAFLHTRPQSVVLTTAPTARQVQHVLWREIRRAHAESTYPLLGIPLTTRYEINQSWYALGFKAKATNAARSDENDSAFQGFHAESALVVIDEAAGVPESVFDELEAVMTSENARMLLIGNPTSVSGTFRESFYRDRSLWHRIRISAWDTPNFVNKKITHPFLVTPDWVNRQIHKRGRKHPYVISRIDALFPDIGINKLIPINWLDAAIQRTEGEFDKTRVLYAGVDVARFGDDETCLTIRSGDTVLEQHAWGGFDITESAATVNMHIDRYEKRGYKVEDIRVDTIGLGGGVADILRNTYDRPVTDINVSERASDPDEWPNFRHEMWWQLRERFDIDNPSIKFARGMVEEREGQERDLKEPELYSQLSDIEYEFKGKYTGFQIEAKEKTKDRTGSSPDRAESLALAFCNPPPPETIAARPRSAISRDSGWNDTMGARAKSRGSKIAKIARSRRSF